MPAERFPDERSTGHVVLGGDGGDGTREMETFL